MNRIVYDCGIGLIGLVLVLASSLAWKSEEDLDRQQLSGQYFTVFFTGSLILLASVVSLMGEI